MRLAAVACLAALLCGCDPVVRVSGRVVKPNGVSVPGARVWVDCDAFLRRQHLQGTSGDGGTYAFVAVGCLPMDCAVRAEHDGLEGTVPVRSACIGETIMCLDHCIQVDAGVILTRAVQRDAGMP